MRKNKKQVWNLGKKALVSVLALSMVFQSVPGNLGLGTMEVEAASLVEGAKSLDLEKSTTSTFVGGENGWGNSQMTVTESGATATLAVNSFGTENQEWQLQYLVQELNLVDNTKYVLNFDITSSVDKKVHVKLDNSGLIDEVIELKAGETYHYSQVSTAGAFEDQQLYFALGQFDGETPVLPEVSAGEAAATITISDVVLRKSVDPMNLETAETSSFVGGENSWGSSRMTVTESGETATFAVADFGSEGQEWQLQYFIQNLNVADNTEYYLSCDLTSTVDKKMHIKLDDAALIDDVVELKAGEAYHYEGVSTAGEFTDNKLYFAFGQFAGETLEVADVSAGEAPATITISNVKLYSDEPEPEIDTSTGPEYDFNNPSNTDYADPGKTKQDYDLIWSDEFDGNYGADANVDPETGLNKDNWEYQFGDGSTDCSNPGWGNNELQCYTGDKKNVAVNEDLNGDGQGDGMLRITASYEEDGYTYGKESTKKYTSARIRTTSATDELFNTTYGYIEARMSLPATKGAWPAFWMLPQSTEIYGGWPVSGEIDIMETCGALPSGKNDQTCSTLHWGTPVHVYKGSGYTSLASDYTDFHAYAVDWEPGKMTFYYDGVEIYSRSTWESGISGASDTLSFDAPFDAPFYVLLNLAVDSGQFGGKINKATFQGDINMYVDYVRAFQKTEGYPDSVVRTSSGNANPDWADYAGINQIGEVAAGNIVSDIPDGDMSGVEQAGNVDNGKWYLAHQADAADATAEPYTDADGKEWAKVGINTKGSQDYAVQLIGHYDAKEGYVYKVSFDAYAEDGMVGKTVNCDSKEWKSWGTYGALQYELKDTPTHYSYLIDQTESFDQCRIEFNLGGQGSGTAYIGNVKVEIVDPSIINSEKEHTALADGNLIYNGSFDQGDNHIGYWTASDGTTLKVPRYTTEKLAEGDVSVVDVASKTNYEKIADGVKYYERRAQISAEAGTKPEIYQTDLKMPKDTYTLKFDLYSAAATTVTAAIYEVNVTGEGDTAVKTLGNKLYSTTANYTDAGKVKSYKWAVDTEQAVENAALVLTFGDGAAVQVDNVSLIGESLGEKVDETPMNEETTWEKNDQDGAAGDVVFENGVYTIKNITSGSGTAWYAPQIVSNDFALSNGNEYKLSFQYKLEGDSNQTLQYIVQENGGSWTVFGDGPTEITYDPASADADGFCSYEVKIPATTSLKNVHMVFGLGKSQAKDCTFSFKNLKMVLAGAGGSGEGGDDSGSDMMPGSSYKITYELNGGTNAETNPARYTEGKGIASLAAPAKDGYTFLGWTIGAEGTNYVTAISKEVTGDLTLYANWKENQEPKPEPEVSAAAPVISSHPAGKTYTYNAKATALTVGASVSDGGSLSYQWYSNTVNSTSGAKAISGATAASYVPSTRTIGTVYYYCVVTNTNSKATGTKTASSVSKIAAVKTDKAANKITGVASSYKKAIGTKPFTLKAKGQGKITYSISKKYKNVATVTAGGKVTLKGIGKAVLTVKAAGNGYYKPVAKNITITVTPKKAVLSSVKSTKSKTLTVKWKRDTKATGYKVQYATNKKFSKAKTVTIKKNKITSATIKKLKGNKKYYVRVCAYKKVGKTTVTGSWSNAKSSKVRK